MTINSSPVLTGESAKAFFEEAEQYAKLPTPRLTQKREEELREMDNVSREFMQNLKNKLNG